MTVEELYALLTKDNTPEEVLMRLLAYQIEDYESLKNMGVAPASVNPIMMIACAAMDLGWHLAIEEGEPDAQVEGICVGTDAYLTRLLDKTK